MIDDGSKDNSLCKIKKYERDYPEKIKIFSHQNSGVGKTRNLGIDNATGDYITFIDADDAFEIDAISFLVNAANKKTDVVISGYKRINEKNAVEFESNPVDCIWTELKYVSNWSKLYKLNFLNKHKIRYNSFEIGEDVCFCLSCFTKTNNIKILSESKYLYYYNSNSVTSNIGSTGKIRDFTIFLNEIYNNIDLGKYDKKMIQFFYIKTIVQNIIMQLNTIDITKLNELYNKNYIWLEEKQINTKTIKLLWPKGETFSVNLIVNVFILATKLHLQKYLIFILKKNKKIRMK